MPCPQWEHLDDFWCAIQPVLNAKFPAETEHQNASFFPCYCKGQGYTYSNVETLIQGTAPCETDKLQVDLCLILLSTMS